MPAPLLLHVFPSFAVGGAQARFATLANRFGPAFRHAVVAMDGVTSCRERLDPGLDLRILDVAARKGGAFANLGPFRRILRELAPAALVTSNWGAIEWALANLIAGVRHVHMEDGFGPEERARQLPRRVWTRRLALRRSIVLLPSLTLAALARDVWRLPARRLRHVPNGVDLAAYAVRPAGFRNAEPVIGTVAGLRAEKNVGRLIGAVALLATRRDVRLSILGDGPERSRLLALAADRGIFDRVDFAGHVADPAAAYAGFDVFALSSDTEQMPLSVLEAMASGLPVASTDVGDVRCMLAAENAPFVTPLDEAALADALDRLLADPARGRAIGLANRAKAERDFGQDSMFAAHRAAWDGELLP